ncbi:MAG TPA: discoidin domain-containing protein, partial [Bacteroidales bacterium]|nr:discoidin domain-containing protein [Bacteroidales bacterium]
MKHIAFRFGLWSIFLVLLPVFLPAQSKLLDGMEDTSGWELILSDGVEASLHVEKGVTGQSIRFDYDFTKGTGYGGMQKFIALDLPEHFEISFLLKAESPSNNFEVKFIDESGHNVWWVNNRNYDFPKEWQRIRIKRRHISFAWGPTHDRYLSRMSRIEFTVASFLGGKGSVWIDDLRFEALEAPPAVYPNPRVVAVPGQRGSKPQAMLDGRAGTGWKSQMGLEAAVELDFGVRREFGGLQIDWLDGALPRKLELEMSLDGKQWEKIWEADGLLTQQSFIPTKEAEALRLRLKMSSSKPQVFGVGEISLLPVEASLSHNDFFRHIAKQQPKGLFPRYFLDQALYWTVSGVNNDT